MAVVTPKPDDLIFGLELGPDTSVVATGTRQEVEECVNVGGLTKRFNRHDFPSTVAFSGKIRLYGEEAECRVNYEPKDTLVCLPMWIPVQSAAEGQEVERRLTYAPLVETTIHKGSSVVFHVDVDRKKVAVPFPVVLGDFLRYLRHMALAINKTYATRVGNLKGVQLRQQLHQERACPAHAGIVVVPAFVTARDLRPISAALGVAGTPMQIINRTSAVVNWWCCDKLPHEFPRLQQLQKLAAAAGGGGKEEEGDGSVCVGILDVGAMDISFVLLELRPGNHPDVNQEALMRQPQQQVAVKVLAGETAANLGFQDVVRLLSEKVKHYLKEAFHVEVREHTERYWKLFLACSKCVKTLYDVEHSVVDIDDFVVKKTHLRMDCSRKHLQQICAPLIEPYRQFLLNTVAKAGVVATTTTAAVASGAAGEGPKKKLLAALYAIGTRVRVPWMLEITEEILGNGARFPSQPHDHHHATIAGASSASQERLQFITEKGGQVAPYGAAYFAAGKSYIRCMQDESQPYSDAEMMEMTSLEQQLTQIEMREISRREMYAKAHTYVLEMRHAALSLYPTLLADPDRTAKVVRDAEAAIGSLRDASEEQLTKVHQEFRSYFEGHEKTVYDKVETARLQRMQHLQTYEPKRTMDLVIRHIGEDRNAPLPTDAALEKAKRDLEESKRLIESGQYDLGIFTAEKSLQFWDRMQGEQVGEEAAKEKLNEMKVEALLQLAKAQTLKAQHDRAIEERSHLLEAAISHATAALALEPESVEAYLLRGRAFMKKGDLANAEKDANEGLKLLPGSLPCRALLEEVKQRSAQRT